MLVLSREWSRHVYLYAESRLKFGPIKEKSVKKSRSGVPGKEQFVFMHKPTPSGVYKKVINGF